jgi:Flp pilus assembly protein CpaB
MQMSKLMPSGNDVRRKASNRNGSLVVALVVALIAGGFLLLFLNNYRDSVNDTTPVTVLVAKSLIEKGSAGDVVITNGMYDTKRITKSEESDGAITQPEDLRNQVATADVFPGEQLTDEKFAPTTNSPANKLSGDERAISLPLDSAHGLIGDIHAGDRVDVLAGFNVDVGSGPTRPMLRAVMQNALVLKAPANADDGGVTGNETQKVLLRAPDRQSWKFAFSSEFGKVWLVLRPKAGAEQAKPSVVTLETVLLGTKPIDFKGAIRRFGGGR